MKRWATALVSSALIWATQALAADGLLPPNAVALIPKLVTVQQNMWPDTPFPVYLAGQVEQESCISLTSKRCWSPYAELKTAREYGFGLSQFTVAYAADGSERFNTWKDLKAQVPQLRDWGWDDRYSAEKQLTGFVWMMRKSYSKIVWPTDLRNHYAFATVSYNSGLGGILKDRTLCGKHPGCNPDLWYDNVELYSTKSKTPAPGYKTSFFTISRQYPKNVEQRSVKYERAWNAAKTNPVSR